MNNIFSRFQNWNFVLYLMITKLYAFKFIYFHLNIKILFTNWLMCTHDLCISYYVSILPVSENATDYIVSSRPSFSHI